MAAKPLLGELLVQQNLVSQEILNEALRLQITGYRRLGSILVRMGALSEDQLIEVLAKQLDVEPTDIKNSFSATVRKKLPRHLCRKYHAVPLRLKSNNILEVAMADPSDRQAISDLEQYTGHIVEPRLARYSDIASATTRHIPLTFSDILSHQARTNLAIALCFILVAALGSFSYLYITKTVHGEITLPKQGNPYITYSNHDLTVSHNPKTGEIVFSGRGAYSPGLYQAKFNVFSELDTFRKSHKSDLSKKQDEWLEWVLLKIKSMTSKSIASKQ